jgi:hypothetical protein
MTTGIRRPEPELTKEGGAGHLQASRTSVCVSKIVVVASMNN